MSSSSEAKSTPLKKPKVVVLLSGGLDSNLSTRLIMDQEIEVEAVAVKTPFCDFDCGKGCGHRVKEVADSLGIRLKTVYFGDQYLSMLKNPKHGFGSGMNPCIDCRAMMFKAAKDHMESIGASYLVTGEVLSQRPMSQHRHALRIIEEESDLVGKVIRPLSAGKLPPSDAERLGIIDRSKLHSIAGRSRKGQLALAKQFGIQDPPNSAGGCLLTDPAFSKRVYDLFEHTDGVPSLNDVELLKVGRHFRLSTHAKLVVGRNQRENGIMKFLYLDDDYSFEAIEFTGPLGILRIKKGSEPSNDLKLLAGGIVGRYSDAPRDQMVKLTVFHQQKEITMDCQMSDNSVARKLSI
ncbi:MAG: tRNA (5-methylaminomethyl-2-thiouridylate)-methyltransferase [Nitrososphaeraceae archaeon]